MINTKVKILASTEPRFIEKDLNEFLATIDTRQIIKTDYSTTCSNYSTRYSMVIFYVNIEDIRDAKLDNILDIK